MPMAKVRMGLPRCLAAMAQTRLESSPPESRNPIGASASSRLTTAAVNFSRMLRLISSGGSSMTRSTRVTSAYRMNCPSL